MNRKHMILAVLVGALLVSVMYAYLEMPRLEKAPPRVSGEKAPVATIVKDDVSSGQSGRIDFSYLENGQQAFEGAKRDIFRFAALRTEKKIIEPQVTETIVPEAVEEVIETVPVVPIEVVQRSLGQFTFLGFLDKAGEKTVFLSSGGSLFLVGQGEKFGVDNEFHVNAIEENTLKVTHSGVDRLIEIPLIEKKKLSAALSAPARREPLPEPAPTMNRIFKPQKNVKFRPENPEQEETLRELIEEYSPEEEQEQVEEKGDEEGEVNGTNQ